MKIIFITTMLFLFPILGIAQDSTTIGKKKEKPVVQSDDKINFSPNMKKKNDVFIDKDGDGICDFRAKGMSFEKLKKRNRQGLGDGKGKGKGNH
ncbi:MAG: hypothetical protein WC209_00695 [Ignavibacteriaceae bacterium]|jgi:hypothetical protein